MKSVLASIVLGSSIAATAATLIDPVCTTVWTTACTYPATSTISVTMTCGVTTTAPPYICPTPTPTTTGGGHICKAIPFSKVCTMGTITNTMYKTVMDCSGGATDIPTVTPPSFTCPLGPSISPPTPTPTTTTSPPPNPSPVRICKSIPYSKTCTVGTTITVLSTGVVDCSGSATDVPQVTPPTLLCPTPTPKSTVPVPTNCPRTWEQCSGIYYTGPKCCQAGSVCTDLNQYYGQCLPTGK
ncbi:hypothetical protein HDV00_009829 [Rhizophlyctis rosea]|nr:hypothetical protein HDV00_009829 [Rhizophlyctis rosea]